ncbi:MAG: hypothetical protein GY854_18405 [Deltaproteobacteria bacterium]|nr:hypothetical protein [Deltaproteobacteria bacterium]
MDDVAQKAIYINLYLLAGADGKIVPEERDYLARFTAAAGIADDQARAWREEVHSGQTQFRPIEGEGASKTALALMARMVRVDEEFGEEEQAAYVNMGKALGFTQEQLGSTLREYWNKDPLDEPQTPPAPTAEKEIDPGAVLLVRDDISDMEQLKEATGATAMTFCTMSDVDQARPQPKIVIFHAAESKSDSKARLELLLKQFQDLPIAFIARRDQAPQIGYLLEHGAKRCFVEPLYSKEIAKAVGEILGND